ncbi:MAG: hypothetical protein DCC73_04115 [Proteobacteria bacterium]|nr:MAG: hypothetical protein DCC73_04115 [Pseudomonadota bacterium]
MSKKLSSADVARLLADPSDSNRADTARKVGQQFTDPELSGAERQIIQEIFRVMVKDAAVRVREALSDTLKDNPDIPREIALALANDVAEVASPILEFSDVFSDEDLLNIIAKKDSEHQQAVARRQQISERVADALVDTENAKVVSTLVQNKGAEISTKTMKRVVDVFADDRSITEALAQRQNLPITVGERLVNLVSEKIRDHLQQRYKISQEMVTDLFLNAREKATIGLLQPDTNLRDVLALIDQLHRNKRLTPTLILRSICMGDTTFFEAALARLADVPIANAYQLIHDQSGLGLKRLFEKCGLSPRMLEVCRGALNVAADMELNSGDDRIRFRQLVIERVLTRFEEGFDPDNLDYFIAKLGRAARAA